MNTVVLVFDRNGWCITITGRPTIYREKHAAALLYLGWRYLDDKERDTNFDSVLEIKIKVLVS
jgi:hypothetical protein